MIPKIIHYCWLSNDNIPKELQECIATWKRQLPDYEFMLWNFDRFDKKSSLWVQQAFDNKKYAFAADYIRLYALYNYGGIYLDMDVEVLKSFNPFLCLKTILCFEKDGNNKLEMAAFGTEKGTCWLKECLTYYEKNSFIHEDGTFNTKVIPLVVRDVLASKYNLRPVFSLEEAKATDDNTIPIFSSDFFSPKSYITNKIEITPNTVCIHHFTSSWISPINKIKLRGWNYLSTHCKWLANIIRKIWGRKV